MAGDDLWLRKYRRSILHATGNGNINYIKSRIDSDDPSIRMEPMKSHISRRKLLKRVLKLNFLISLPGSSRNNYISRSMGGAYEQELQRSCMLRRRSIFREPSRETNDLLLKAIWDNDSEEMQRALYEGANPNATCSWNNICALHVAALKSEKTLSILLSYNPKKNREDDLGRTPLHFAAWAGNVNSIVLLADSSEDQHENELIDSVNNETGDLYNMNEIQNANDLNNSNISIPIIWYDTSTHYCRKNELPPIQKGWTPLHAASSNVQVKAVKYLLSTGADTMKCDETDFTPLDVIASSWNPDDINIEHFSELLEVLFKYGGKFASSQERRDKYNSPLHTALKLKNLEMLQMLLKNGAQTDCTDDSGDTIFHVCVMDKLENCLRFLVDSEYFASSQLTEIINKKNKKGENVLHTALTINWLPGVHLAIKFDADVISQTNCGNTAIHIAAEIGNIDTLDKILSVCKAKGGLNHKNEKGETAFCRAVSYGHLSCIKSLIKTGADPLEPVTGNLTAIHIASKHGYVDILKFLLSIKPFVDMINWQTSKEHEGFTPLHFAASYNHPECVRLLITAGANVCVKSNFEPYDACTPLHEAVVKNNIEVITTLIEADRASLKEVDNFGWTPLHSASFFRSREAIVILLKNGSEILVTTHGPNNLKVTAIDLIMNNLSRPTEFLEDVFDYFIASNDLNVEMPNCLITIDYRIISPDESLGQSKAIKALLATGNRFDQRRLLVHPLVESFVYLKWRSLLPWFYVIVSLYSLFVLTLNIYIVSVFSCQDMEADISSWFHEALCRYIIYLTASILILYELLGFKFKLSYFCQLEVPVNFISITLAISLPRLIGGSPRALDWPRHLATIELLLSWLQMLLIISKFPQWGYYVQMFGKVSSIVVKVLLTFSFVVVGFSLSFMIQFHSQKPFDGPWTALIKTMVMMTSEYDYEDIFKQPKFQAHIEINRVLFVIFLVLAGIVLMNLLVGLAVNDLQFLKIQGNIRRIEKQVEFLASLDSIMENPIVRFFLPKNNFYLRKHNLSGVMLKPDNPNWGAYKSIPQKLRNAIFDKIQSKCFKDDVIDSKVFRSKLNEIFIVDKDVVNKVDRMNEDISNIIADMKSLKEILNKLDKMMAAKS